MIRTAWNEQEEEWYFSVIDVVGVLTESIDYQTARNYWKVLKTRLKTEGFEPVTNCNQLKMKSAAAKNISQTENPKNFEENQSVARRGGRIAGNARKELEAEIGHSVISEQNATQINSIVTNLIEDVSKKSPEDK